MDPAKFRTKVLLRHLTSPLTLVPLVFGFSLVLLAWGAGEVGWLLAGGLAGLLSGAGAFATNAILRSETVARRIYVELQAADFARREAALNALDARLASDQDPRDEDGLRALRALYAEFQKDARLDQSFGATVAVEIGAGVDRLYAESIASLERCLELANAAREVREVETRGSLLKAREQVLAELATNITQLSRTLDGLRTMKLMRHDDENLARVRAELEESLKVATRVEGRLQDLERDLARAGGERE